MEKESLIKSYRKRYRLALLAVAFIAIVIQAYLQLHFHNTEINGQIINLSGRQRMLSQKVTKEIFLYQNRVEKENANVQQLVRDFQLLNETHQRLFTGDLSALNTATINEKYSSLDQYLEKFTNVINCIKKACPDNTDLDYVNETSVEFLQVMNSIVFEYEALNRKSIQRISIVEFSLLLFTLFILWLEAKLIFSPLVDLFKKYLNVANSQKQTLLENSGLVEVGRQNAYLIHEIKNMMAIIMGSTRLLRSNPSKEKTEKHLEVISETSQRLIDLIDSTRRISKKKKVGMEKIEIPRLFEQVRLFCEYFLKEYSIHFKTVIKTEQKITGNISQITQVILNLVNNSKHAINKQEEKWIVLEANEINGQVVISVTDSGDGIPVDLREKIFEPFFSTKTDSDGTGVGLDVCKEIIEDTHHGKLYYNSESKNTQFVIELSVS
ncbi:MAG: ATP-binding protein [Bdellovibrionota bacterium]|nr:ATP-binding protein [Bdellovibrionota bacterium]